MSAKNFVNHHDAEINLDDTCLQGSIQATTAQLTKAFGLPLVDGLESRTPLEWRLQFASGEVASIYLWKQPIPADHDVVSFHIGGRHPEAVRLVHQAFRKSEGLRAAA